MSRYVLEYGEPSPSTGRSLLRRVARYDAGGNALPATDLTYTEVGAHVASRWPYPVRMPSELSDWTLAGDFTGSGKTSIARTAFEQDLWGRTWAWNHWHMAIPTGSSSFSFAEWRAGVFAADEREELIVGDFNGDGRTDIARAAPGYDGWVMDLSTGSTFQWPETWSTSPNAAYEGRTDVVLTGDFNGDGLTDVARASPGWRHWRMSLSNGTGFDNPPDWPLGSKNRAFLAPGDTCALDPDYSGCGTYYPGVNKLLTGDYDGDGRSDILLLSRVDSLDFDRNVSVSRWDAFLSLSRGTGFETLSSGAWLEADRWNSGLIFDRYEKKPGEPGRIVSRSHLNDLTAGDVNGDGLTDLILLGGGPTEFEPTGGFPVVYLSTGSGFVRQDWRDHTAAAPPFANYGVALGDFDGDGRQDVALNQSGSSNWTLLHSRGGTADTSDVVASGWRAATTQTLDPYDGSAGGLLFAEDVNGTGRSDVLRRRGSWSYFSMVTDVAGDHATVPDLLQLVTNGIGGSVEYFYRPSSAYDNTRLPYVVQTLSRRVVADGLGGSSTTSYDYAGGYHDFATNEFRGFSWVQVTQPDGSIRRTWFHQRTTTSFTGCSIVYEDVGYLKGRPIATETRGRRVRAADGTWVDGPLLSSVAFEWGPWPAAIALCPPQPSSTSFPVFVRLKSRTSTLYHSAGNAVTVETHEHDELNGNLKSTRIDPAGGEYIIRAMEYRQLGRWTWRVTRESVSGPRGLARDTRFEHYASGQLHVVRSLVEPGQDPLAATVPQTTLTYHPDGNVWTIAQSTENGDRLTVLTYDDVSQTHPKEVVQPTTSADGRGASPVFAHSTYVEFDQRFGLPLSITDENDSETRNSYDGFGRLTHTRSYEGAYGTALVAHTERIYDLFVFPVRIQERATEAVESGVERVIAAETYLDGFGRAVKSMRPLPTGWSTSLLRYDAMGRVAREIGPFAVTAGPDSGLSEPPGPAPYVAYAYDELGRPRSVETMTSDRGRAVSATSYAALTATTLDADGRASVVVRDGSGRIRSVIDYPDGATPVTTTYEYTAAADLTSVKIGSAEQMRVAYDLLGRPATSFDRDLGSWSYQYWRSGELRTQTDARDIVTTVSYDELGRPLLKTFSNGDPEVRFDTTRCARTMETRLWSSPRRDSEGAWFP